MPDDRCRESTFAALLPPNAEIERVDAVAAGDSYGEGAANKGFPKNPANLPELCAVTVKVKSSLSSSYRFGLFLPRSADGEEGDEHSQRWNSRFLAVGNAGFAGGIHWLEMGVGARYGFASLSTDTGHNSTGTDLSWALRNPEARTDWGWRALHGSVGLGKQLVEAYYSPSTSSSSPSAASPVSSDVGSSSAGSVIKYSYYSGCSTGGRQGLKELQIAPGSFDGVLVGAAAWDTSHLNNWATKVAQWNWVPDGARKSGHVPWKLLQPLAAAVVEQCDGIDGVEDGIISAPERCNIDFGALTCGDDQKSFDAESDSDAFCLTEAQIDTLKKVYGDWVSSETGELLQPGLLPGSESQMYVVLNYSNASPYAVGYSQYFLFDDPEFGPADFNDSVVQVATQYDPGQATADLYDLSAFRRRGGKLLMYHGMADALVPARGSELYYNRTVEAMGGNITQTREFFRYFAVPGMQHCGDTAVDAPWVFGGSYQAGIFGNDTYSVPGFEGDRRHDILLALMDWVERDDAADAVVATAWQDSGDPSTGILRQRPLCAYPSKATWDGVGNVDQASSWSCGGDNGDNSDNPATAGSPAQEVYSTLSTVIGLFWLLFMSRMALFSR